MRPVGIEGVVDPLEVHLGAGIPRDAAGLAFAEELQHPQTSVCLTQEEETQPRGACPAEEDGVYELAEARGREVVLSGRFAVPIGHQ